MFQGCALHLTSGVPVYGMPSEFSQWLGFGEWFGIGVSIWVAGTAAVLLWVFLTWTRSGRHIYAVGSSPHAAKLSGSVRGACSSSRTLSRAFSRRSAQCC